MSHVTKINVVGDIYEIWENAGKATKNPFDFNVQGHIHTICNEAFDGSKISSITVTERIIEIENNAFYECENLESIDLETVEVIGHAAFQCCYNLQQVTIGENCERIGEGAFTACPFLNIIIIKATIPPFLDSDNTPLDGPYIFEDNATIYVPDVTTYENAEPWWWYYKGNLDYISNYQQQ